MAPAPTRIVRVLSAIAVAFSLQRSVRLAWGDLGTTQFDDAYMFLRYAKHWLAGSGFSWNTVDGAAYGTTSAAHLFVVTALRGLTELSDATILTGASFVCGLLACVAIALLGFLAADGAARRAWTPLLAIPCVVFMPAFHFHSLTGMETTLSLLTNALLACAVVVFARRASTLTIALCLAAGYLSYLARPDNGLYALLLPPLFLLASNRPEWRRGVLYAAAFLLIVAFDLGLKQWLFGSPWPLPFYAKRYGFYQGYLGAHQWNALGSMLVFWKAALPFVLVVLATCSRRAWARLGAIAVPVVLTFSYYTTVLQIMGFGARFYYPSLPFFAMAAFVSLSTRVSLQRSLAPAVLWRMLAAAIVLLPALVPPLGLFAARQWQERVIGAPRVYRARTVYRSAREISLPPLRWWTSIVSMAALLERMPPGVTLAASEYGFIGACLPQMKIVDLVGLNDRHVARHGFSAAYVFSQTPDIIWLPHSDYSRAVAEILDSETFAREYDYYPGVHTYGLALRRGGPHANLVRAVTEAELAIVYPGLSMADLRALPAAHLGASASAQVGSVR